MHNTNRIPSPQYLQLLQIQHRLFLHLHHHRHLCRYSRSGWNDCTRHHVVRLTSFPGSPVHTIQAGLLCSCTHRFILQ